ncbi:unnamed protein product [Chondrus crispus]|uniref:Uncharacterized protein n=1 Tax=Chondrus crispus TaxID=2769 RepID=R7QNE3_CHOCR|nr:unnamed protein product [Chondrus crispus]CDF39313.1 unnamed protein product [Chondrus crispus]|eukprot:XP_005719224.1 unnamed protein product [Chondrus crispus]
MQSDKPILDVKKFLSRKIVDNSKSKTVLSVILQAHSRAIEAIRSHFVKAFLHALPSHSPLNPIQDGHGRTDHEEEMEIDHEDDENDCEDAERNREFNAAKVAALRLHESGEYKLLSKYDTCWEKACFKAQREARSYAANYRDNLLRFCDCGTLPEIPKAQRDTRKMISVFSLALPRMKVGNGI